MSSQNNKTLRCYHIISKKDWENEKNNRQFGQSEMMNYGYIHSSKYRGLQKIIKRYLDKEFDYLVLVLDVNEDLATYEDKDGEHIYPHFYHLLDRDCVVDVKELVEW